MVKMHFSLCPVTTAVILLNRLRASQNGFQNLGFFQRLEEVVLVTHSAWSPIPLTAHIS